MSIKTKTKFKKIIRYFSVLIFVYLQNDITFKKAKRDELLKQKLSRIKISNFAEQIFAAFKSDRLILLMKAYRIKLVQSVSYRFDLLLVYTRPWKTLLQLIAILSHCGFNWKVYSENPIGRFNWKLFRFFPYTILYVTNYN